jgi:GNAT superfamily N-acetyltransferase
MTPPNIAIDYLANCPEFVGELARLSWREWQEVYEQRKQTLDHSLKNYRERMNTDRLPLTLVALHSGELVGMVSLKFHDMDTRPDLDPWLGGLLVLPEWRNRGVGNDADASRHRTGSSIKCATTLSLDPFSRKALPRTWLAGRRTNQLLRQGSRGDEDRSWRAVVGIRFRPSSELLSRHDASASRGG